MKDFWNKLWHKNIESDGNQNFLFNSFYFFVFHFLSVISSIHIVYYTNSMSKTITKAIDVTTKTDILQYVYTLFNMPTKFHFEDFHVFIKSIQCTAVKVEFRVRKVVLNFGHKIQYSSLWETLLFVFIKKFKFCLCESFIFTEKPKLCGQYIDVVFLFGLFHTLSSKTSRGCCECNFYFAKNGITTYKH